MYKHIMTKEIKTACGSEIVDKEIFVTYDNKIIYFCEEECRVEFLENPKKFLDSDHFLIDFDLLPTISENEELLSRNN